MREKSADLIDGVATSVLKHEGDENMGFFDALFGGQQPQKPADPALLAVFAAPPPNSPTYKQKDAAKAISKESDGIMAILHSTGETPLVVAHTLGWTGENIIVVTDRRTFTTKNGSIKQELSHQEVAETKLGAMPNGNTLVTIESRASRLDYAPTDVHRYSQIIVVEVATPRIGNMICAEIDQRLKS